MRILRINPRTPIFVLAFAPMIAACGGAAPQDLFGKAGPGASGDDTADSFDAGLASTFDASSPVDASLADTYVADTFVADTYVADTYVAPPVDPGILCPMDQNTNAYCTVGSQVCCQGGDNSNPSFVCETDAECGSTLDISIPCDNSVECTSINPATPICCVSSNNFGTITVRCAASCEDSNTSSRDILCTSDDDCPSGETCVTTEESMPYKYCQ